MTQEELYELQTQDRENYTKLIIESNERYKLIVAGPGTGKTFTFKSLLKTKDGNNLALTFINSLATDLQNELGELAESHTFHGYCKKLLHTIPEEGITHDFVYYPKLPSLIKRDGEYLNKNYEKFEEAFQTLNKDDKIEFYLERANYYNAVGHNDSVYRVLKYFQNSPTSLPSYTQIVVDEYQDFNPLEVAFIAELIKNSPMLIAGDDDQAIYNFKNSSPDEIREKAADSCFVKFELPYCSRCTEVIVNAVHDITTKAVTLGKLQNRIKKKYQCFLPGKATDNDNNPMIIHIQCSVNTKKCPYIGMYIVEEISKIPEEEIHKANNNGYPSVLIIGPSHYTKQVYDYLSDKFTNIDNPESNRNEIEIIDGYKILMNDHNSNIGWRIVTECAKVKNLDSVIRASYNNETAIVDQLDDEYKSTHLRCVSILETLKDTGEMSTADYEMISKFSRYTPDEFKKMLSDETAPGTENTDESIKIKLTTINGSKGLSADYVFIIGFNDGEFPRNALEITDNEICQLVVGLTRARKRCYLISNSSFGAKYRIPRSSFVDWIDQSRIEHKLINATYFKK